MKIVKRLMRLSTVFMVVSVLAVSACGGKKSSTTATVPTPLPTAKLSSVVPASGAANAAANSPVVFTLAVTDATSSDGSKLSYQCNGNAVVFTPANTLTGSTMTVTLTPTTAAQITANTPCAVSGNITTTGPNGSVTTAVNTSFSEVSTTLHYTDAVYTIYGAARYPYLVTQGGVTPAANMTGGAMSLCALYATRIDNGIIPVLCVDSTGVNHFLYIDPSTNELWPYNGATPLDAAYTGQWHQIPWGTTAEYEYVVSGLQYNLVTGAYAIIPNGIFFIEKISPTTLEFAQNMDFSNITTVPVTAAATGGGCVTLLGINSCGTSSTSNVGSTFGVIISYSN